MSLVTETRLPNRGSAFRRLLALALPALLWLGHVDAGAPEPKAGQAKSPRVIRLAGVRPTEFHWLGEQDEHTVMLPDGRFVHLTPDTNDNDAVVITLLDSTGTKTLARKSVPMEVEVNSLECFQHGQELYLLAGWLHDSLEVGRVSFKGNKPTYTSIMRAIHLPSPHPGPFPARLTLGRTGKTFWIGMFDYPKRDNVERPSIFEPDHHTTRFRSFRFTPFGMDSRSVTVYPTAVRIGPLSRGEGFLVVSDSQSTKSSVRIIKPDSSPVVLPLQTYEEAAASTSKALESACAYPIRVPGEDLARLIAVDRRGHWMNLGTISVGKASVFRSSQRLSDSRAVIFTREVLSERDVDGFEEASDETLFTWSPPTAWFFRRP